MSFARIFAVFIVAVVLASCGTSRSGTYLVETKGPYLLDTGDVVRVSVYGDDQLSNLYKIDDAGKIALPLVGPVMARGLTSQATGQKIAAALSNGYLRNPDVAVEVAEYRPFFIQGAVNSSGQYAYVYGMTVRAAIATAGGYSETAMRDRVTVFRPQGTEMVKGSVDLDFPVYPGDTIVVPDRWL